MRVMTITADRAGLMHFALHPGAVYIVFIADLTIWIIQRPLRQHGVMSVEQFCTVVVIA
jgi:hypothetical protein